MNYSQSLVALLFLTSVICAQDLPIEWSSPVRNQVVQRVGFLSSPTSESIAQDSLGSAEVEFAGSFPEAPPSSTQIEYRVILIGGELRTAIDWTNVNYPSTRIKGNQFRFTVTIPAGGWYKLELRTNKSFAGKAAFGSIEPFGVGEIFLVAGQSYAVNANDERLKVQDPKGRVVALNTINKSYVIAHDPQPILNGGDGGSIWPALGDSLLNELEVPIAFANVAVGGTSSSQWLPNGDLHPRLIEAGKHLGRFRAVLWQQGESDVIAKTSIETYVANLKRIRQTAIKAWGFEPVWLCAKSTHHPTVYNVPDGEGRIRQAIDQLSKLQGFGAGPDTDTLIGDNRGDAQSRRHFSAIGQRRAAALWYSTLMDRLKKVPTGIEAASFLLNGMHLLEPAWTSETVYGESCVLRQSTSESPMIGTLAFRPAEILKVVTADKKAQIDLTRLHLQNEPNHSLRFDSPTPVNSILESSLFLPVDAPNSYRHRLGHPEQSLLYRPGRWFHDRNIEITYRRDVAQDPYSVIELVKGSLPKTISRLVAGEPVTIGISGDSISTGLDASATTSTPPFQPGYPDLFVAQLRVMFDSDIALKNRAVGGWSVANGVADLPKLLEEKPDLIVVAYGMNDVGRRDPNWFHDQTRTIIERAQEANPNIEIVLVSTMLGNREWVHTPRDMFALYRDKLQSLVSPGVALADVTAVWDLMLKNKSDYDLTGNGLNHPNDFGHRLYAQTILQLFAANRP